jgi:four helix bundle protein
VWRFKSSRRHTRFTIYDLRFTIEELGSQIVDEEEFKRRTKGLGLRVIRLVEALPEKPTAQVIGKQLLRSATSVGANYRAACRGRSVADVIAKLKIVEEEADETLFWLELLVEADLIPESRLSDLMRETDEVVAMTVASIKTLRSRQNRQSPVVNRKSQIANRKSQGPVA